ncbi:MAG: hypothetical protein HQL32_15830 [Planctomycetes bacterium]|nr:hypothetical protein [Planctomycetota bacterium]
MISAPTHNSQKISEESPDCQRITYLEEDWYRMPLLEDQDHFLMTIVSSSDHWMFISSSGALSCGRKDRDNALFPYANDDYLCSEGANAGPKTCVLVEENTPIRWEPFSSSGYDVYNIERALYKNIQGSSVLFEEHNKDLGLIFRYRWESSEDFGFIRTCWLENMSSKTRRCRILDGMTNVLPHGVQAQVQREFSTLLTAYKRSEYDLKSKLAVYSLSSRLTDLAEPSESLQATTIWAFGHQYTKVFLSDSCYKQFRRGGETQSETKCTGKEGAFLAEMETFLQPGQSLSWGQVAEINQDTCAVKDLEEQLSVSEKKSHLEEELSYSCKKGRGKLGAMLCAVDGIQSSEDRIGCDHHMANALFNMMRGGLFTSGYSIDGEDFLSYLKHYNQRLYKKLEQNGSLKDLENHNDLEVFDLHQWADRQNNQEISRIAREYLPLSFSRRHGDPSRPWNQFAIKVQDEKAKPILDYQGNWRDIFQNWEALSWSYPGYIQGMVLRFLGATTADGYNPYRITRDGIDWEKPEPDNPWANIGYWGDHQIVYLSKLIETGLRFSPEKMHALLGEGLCTHAEVPYRIASYEDLLKDPYNSISFDEELDKRIDERVSVLGADGRMMRDASANVMQVHATEKFIILILAKLSNFVPGGGIWMNTQRPEWNDANNALAGRGLSMVTLCYLHRFVKVLEEMYSESSISEYSLSEEVYQYLSEMSAILKESEEKLQGNINAKERREFLDQVGQAGSKYRSGLYSEGFSGEAKRLSLTEISEFLRLVRVHAAHSIHLSKRQDGLYHAYSILHTGEGTAEVEHLYEMLEGQVAVLSSGVLSSSEALECLQSLRQSALFREDQYSYMLYPRRELTPFRESNTIKPEDAAGISLFFHLDSRGDTSIVRKGESGDFHYNGNFRNENNLNEALDQLSQSLPDMKELIELERGLICDLFEKSFNHAAFTGRSGTIYGYEGLGSIYWHMVSKLLLAIQEQVIKTSSVEQTELFAALRECYEDVRKGIGFNKSAQQYGAFPIDPYSHTPWAKGAKQPGMTGQVKEELLARWAEVGIDIHQGCMTFKPHLLRLQELSRQEQRIYYTDTQGAGRALKIPAKSILCSLCQTPIVITYGACESITVVFHSGEKKEIKGLKCSQELSRKVFERCEEVDRIDVTFV